MYRNGLFTHSMQPNRQHPLLRGMLGWWVGLPGTAGNASFQDVLRDMPGPHQNGVGWSGNTRPGRLGSCPTYTSASSQWTSLPSLDSAMDGLSACTVAFWCYRTPGTGCGFGRSVVTSNRFLVSWHTTNIIYCSIGVPANALAANTASGWHHLLATYDGNAGGVKFQFYLNGVQQAWQVGNNVTATTIPIATGTGLGRTIGSSDLGDVRYSTGPMDDLAVWNRALSASEVRDWYGSSRLGHPETLRRSGMPLLASLESSFVRPWLLQETPVIGSGVY